MGFDLDVSVSVLTVFLQGLLSFFSPCVFPLIPLYVGYLSGGTTKTNEAGETVYDSKKVLLHTLFFIIGVSFAFFLLGFGFSTLGQFFKSNQLVLARVGGVIVFLFGLYQLGVFGNSTALSKEHRLPFNVGKFAMSPVIALVMGFTFSFAWTPCVGPALTSVLLMTASAGSRTAGFVLIGVYTLGFVLPFLAVGIFTTQLLGLFKKHRNVVKYTIKIGGVLMLIMGAMMFTGKMNDLSGYFARLSGTQAEATQDNAKKSGDDQNADAKNTDSKDDDSKSTDNKSASEDKKAEDNSKASIDFTLLDQYGKEHTLSDYKGKTVFLNFWATWCPPCREEMPDIQKLYEAHMNDEGDDTVVVISVAAPGVSGEGTVDQVKEFLEENGYTYPVLMDVTGNVFASYGVTTLPTTFMIDRNSDVYGYVNGQLTAENMDKIVEQTLTVEAK